MEYSRLVRQWDSEIEGVLAIGHATSGWLVGRGMAPEKLFPFAYFLASRPMKAMTPFDPGAPFRFIFVGRLIELKRVDQLFAALASLADNMMELVVVGSGPLESQLRALAEKVLPGRAHWLGQRPIDEISSLMAEADCLVLPSRHDGWGAVVSEALIAGTPAICSDACGATTAVRASGCGGVFRAGDVAGLTSLVRGAWARGRQTPDARRSLAAWARCLSAPAGADYLAEILLHAADATAEVKPDAPWTSMNRSHL